jgi:hypothetical protein
LSDKLNSSLNDNYIVTLQKFIDRYSRAAEAVNETLEGQKGEWEQMNAQIKEWKRIREEKVSQI